MPRERVNRSFAPVSAPRGRESEYCRAVRKGRQTQPSLRTTVPLILPLPDIHFINCSFPQFDIAADHHGTSSVDTGSLEPRRPTSLHYFSGLLCFL